jgi:hypothetical protein
VIQLGLHGRDSLKLNVERTLNFNQGRFDLSQSLLDCSDRSHWGVAVAVTAP